MSAKRLNEDPPVGSVFPSGHKHHQRFDRTNFTPDLSTEDTSSLRSSCQLIRQFIIVCWTSHTVLNFHVQCSKYGIQLLACMKIWPQTVKKKKKMDSTSTLCPLAKCYCSLGWFCTIQSGRCNVMDFYCFFSSCSSCSFVLFLLFLKIIQQLKPFSIEILEYSFGILVFQLLNTNCMLKVLWLHIYICLYSENDSQ